MNSNTGEYNNKNTAIGTNALQVTLSSISGLGNDNTAIGNDALRTLMAGENESTAIGSQSLLTATSGENTAVGAHSGACAGSGANNVLIGNWAARFVSGNDNTVCGYKALANDHNTNTDNEGNIVNGSRNTASGSSSMRYAPSGDDNTAYGYHSLININNGNSNTTIGSLSGINITSGCNNTLIGYNTNTAGTSAATSLYRTAIGSGAVVSTNNTIILGRTYQLNGASIQDKIGIGTGDQTGPLAYFHVKAPNNTPAIYAQSNTVADGIALQTNGGRQYIGNSIITYTPASTSDNLVVNGNNHIIIITGSFGATLTLPDASTHDGSVFVIRNASSASQDVAVSTNYIFGYSNGPTASSDTLAQDTSATYVANNNNYYRIA